MKHQRFIQVLYFAHTTSDFQTENFYFFAMTLVKIFHLIAVVHFYFGLYYDVTYVTAAEVKLRNYEFGGKFVYLTFLTFVSFAGVFLSRTWFKVDHSFFSSFRFFKQFISQLRF